MQFEASLRQPDKNGRPLREVYQKLAARGNPTAIELLTGPDCPMALRYLVDFFWELDRTRKTNINGPEPVGPVEIETMARLLGVQLRPDEVRGLFLFDVAARFPNKEW